MMQDGIWQWLAICATPQDSAFASPTPTTNPLQLQRKASVRLNRLRAGVGRLRSGLHKWGVTSSAACELAQKNKLSTMSSFNVKYIDFPMDCTAWRFWTMRQPNGCSTSAPRSSAAKLLLEQLAQKKKKRFVQLLQNQSLEASHLVFLNIYLLENSFENFLENYLGDPTFSSSQNASPGSAINFTTETKRCRQSRFPILFALIDLTGWFCINSS